MKNLIGPVRLRGKYGYLSESGNFVIQPLFDQIFGFSEGLAGAVSNGVVEFIDSSGKVVIEHGFALASALAPKFSGGLCPVRSNGGMVGYIGPEGSFVIEPQFDYAGNFFQERAIVADGRGYSLIDQSGEIITQFQAYEVELELKDLDFIRCNFRSETSNEFQVGFVNAEGEFSFSRRFTFIDDFSEGMAQFAHAPNGPYGFADYRGEIVVPPSMLNARSRFVDGLAPASLDKRKFGYIGKSGEFVIDPMYSWGGVFSEGLACVCAGGKHGFIDRQGGWVVEPRFFRPGRFENGVAQIEDDKSFLLIDKQGKVLYSENEVA